MEQRRTWGAVIVQNNLKHHIKTNVVLRLLGFFVKAGLVMFQGME